LEYGADPNAKFKMTRWRLRPNIENATSLMIATQDDNKDIVKLLLEYGADATITDSEGDTALAYVGADDSIKRMLENAISRQLSMYLY